MDKRITKKIRDVILDFDEVILGYVFGSFLRQNKAHDLDIAVYIKDGRLNPHKLFKLEMEIARRIEAKLGYRVETDVKVLNGLPLYFQHRVIREGIPIFVKDKSKRIDFETEVISRFQDYQVTLEWFDQQFVSKKG